MRPQFGVWHETTYRIYSLIRRTLNFRRRLWQVSKIKISPLGLEIPCSKAHPSVKSCGINNALDGTEDDAVWDDEEEEAEDAQEPIDNEFETDSEDEDDE